MISQFCGLTGSAPHDAGWGGGPPEPPARQLTHVAAPWWGQLGTWAQLGP